MEPIIADNLSCIDQAIDLLEKDTVMKDALGAHVFDHFIDGIRRDGIQTPNAF